MPSAASRSRRTDCLRSNLDPLLAAINKPYDRDQTSILDEDEIYSLSKALACA